MKLLSGTISPFVRKVSVAAHELGLADRIERVPAAVSAVKPNPEVIAHNPVGKIPTLILDDGEALYDSLVICEYLATRVDDRRLFPVGEARWRALRLNALADGLLTAGVLARTELMRAPEARWAELHDAQWAKVENCLDRLERDSAQLQDEPTIGEIAAGCAIGWVDFRVKEYDWRAGRPALAAWFERISLRPSFQATQPKG